MSSIYNRAICTVERPVNQVSNQLLFWRQDMPIIDGKIVKIGGMWPMQRAWWNLPNFIKLFVAGYGAGKTLIGGKRIIASALHNAPCPVAAVGPTHLLARRTIIATLIELLSGKQKLFGPDFYFRYNRSISEFKIRYHGREGTIIVQSGEDPLKLRGPNLAAAWIDEPFIQEKEVFDQMMARVRHPRAKRPEVFLTGTPEQLNWGFDLAMGDLKAKHDVGYIKGSTRDNPVLNEGYVGRLENTYDDKAADAYIDGEFVNLSTGMFLHAFTTANVKQKEIPEGAEIAAGMDFNVNPMAAAVFWRKGNHMHYFDEIELANADTEYLCQILRERYVDNAKFAKNPLQQIFPDATGSARKSSAPGGKTDFFYIRQAGFHVRAPHENPKPRDRYNAMNGKFKSRGGEITLTMEPTCRKMIKYCSTYSYELANKQEQMSHLVCAMGYPVSYLFPVIHHTAEIRELQGA